LEASSWLKVAVTVVSTVGVMTLVPVPLHPPPRYVVDF
jgi:hypothetical protein